MNILIVYAHHEPSSFTAAMKNQAVQSLELKGHTVTVSDLYGQGFSAIAQKWDFVTTSGNHFNYMYEQKHAVNLEMAFSPDIVAEIQKLANADVVLFVAPLWWLSVPAILKGYFDRVLAMGAAWDSGRIYENGLYRGRQAMLVVSVGHPDEYFRVTGRHRATMPQILHPINHGTLAFCGFNVHEPFIAADVLRTGPEVKAQQLKELEFRLNNLETSPQWLSLYNT